MEGSGGLELGEGRAARPDFVDARQTLGVGVGCISCDGLGGTSEVLEGRATSEQRPASQGRLPRLGRQTLIRDLACGAFDAANLHCVVIRLSVMS